jgi:hypothetical protein
MTPDENRPGGLASPRAVTKPARTAADGISNVCQTGEVCAMAARLVDAITNLVARDEANYRSGYRDATRLYRAIFDHGYEVGWKAAEYAEERKWSGYIHPHLRAAARRGTIKEYQRRLREPRPGDYAGGPVPWEGRTR